MSRFKEWKPPEIVHGVPTKWNWIVLYPKNLEMGYGVDIGALSLIQAEEGVVLEDDVQISGGCKIYSVNTIDGTRGRVVVRRGACVGANSVVLPGVTIGEDAIVGALSLVKTDVPSGEVWGGVPARRIK